MKYSFDEDIKRFVGHINSLQSTISLIMFMIVATIRKADKNLNEYMKKNGIVKLKENAEHSRYRLSFDKLHQFNKLHRQFTHSTTAGAIIPRNFIIALVSQFDAFIGRLIKTMIFIKPEMLNASEKSLTYSQIIEFISLDDVREYIVEKEFESVLRKSHTDQFKWLENKLGTTLRTGLDVWPVFIELTERRNLFTHCDGVISSQYIETCKEHNVLLQPECKIGETLDVTPEYFDLAYRCIYEIGVKLAHVIWRKLQPGDREKADHNINNLCYDLIDDEKYDLAIKLLEFATSMNKFHSEEIKLMLIINKAQAYKWSGQAEKCSQVLSKFDWSACSYSFRLARAVLSDEYSEAIEIMKKIGSNGDIAKSDYRDWPLFKRFRKSKEFRITYLEIFGEEFETVEMEEKQINIDPRFRKRPKPAAQKGGKRGP